MFWIVDFPWFDLVVAETVQDKAHTATSCVESCDAEDDQRDCEEAPFSLSFAHGNYACVGDAQNDAKVAHGVCELLADTIHVGSGEL